MCSNSMRLSAQKAAWLKTTMTGLSTSWRGSNERAGDCCFLARHSVHRGRYQSKLPKAGCNISGDRLVVAGVILQFGPDHRTRDTAHEESLHKRRLVIYLCEKLALDTT